MKKLLSDIPKTIAVAGRMKGFERARDEVFLSWEILAEKMPAYNAIRLALEFDKHALLAEMALLQKGKDTMDWEKFQEWLTTDAPAAMPEADKEDE